MPRFAVLGLIGSLILPASVPAQVDRDYIRAALRGDLSAYAEEEVRDGEAEKAFRARFIDATDGLILKNDIDPLVHRIARLYENYWRHSLVAPDRREFLEQELATALVSALEEAGQEPGSVTLSNLSAKMQEAFEARGYGAIFGRTPPLLEFMVWGNVSQKDYQVALSGGVQPVMVYFLEDFVSRGWVHFATFGQASAGGWTTEKGLYAIRESYDLDSEKFRISYLKHEARHFADKGRYPELQAADMEYRAKLEELIHAQETAHSLLAGFTRAAARIENAPHSLASWYLARDFARTLTDTGSLDPDGINGLPPDDIRKTAAMLLDQHTQALERQGGEQATGVILP